MKKTVLALFLLSLCVLSLFALSSCGSNKEVIVNYGGGQADASLGEKPSLEQIVNSTPTKEGCVFAGWYSDPAFTSYINPIAITKQQKSNATAHAKWITVEESKTYAVRSNSVTVTDTGRSKQPFDKVGIISDYNVLDLQRAGYKSIDVTVSLALSEKDDGYQYIFLYADEKCQDSNISSLLDIYDKYVFGEEKEDPSLLYAYKHDHNPDAADSSWETVTFSVTIELSKLKSDLYIRYGASGNKGDDWLNKDVSVTVSPKK